MPISVPLAKCRWARWASVKIALRSLNNASAEGAAPDDWCSRCALQNNSGSCRIRSRTTAEAERQAWYNWPAWRVEHFRRAKTSPIRWQSWRLIRAIGAKNFMAICGAIAPVRTCSCTGCGRSSTKARRRITHAGLRSKRRARSSTLWPKRRSNSSNSHPSSSAVRRRDLRNACSSSTASSSPAGQTTASTVSRPSRWRDSTR